MSMAAERLLRAYQGEEHRFVERRFPLRYDVQLPAIRELYGQAKAGRWNPDTDVAWDRLDPSAYAPETREAARLTWSRRAWGTYPGLMENTALLIRMCLESNADMDTKLFLSFRPAEEAKHLESCFRLAERFGGYLPDPGSEPLRRSGNHPFAQMALDRDLPVEAFVAALGCLDDQLDLNLYQSHLQHARDETTRQVLRLMCGDKQRHALFAWVLLAHRAPRLDERGRATVDAAVADLLENVILKGYRNVWLVPGTDAAEACDAQERTAAAGLGASTIAAERSVLRATVAQTRERLAALGIAVPRLGHAELGVL
jgi:hypothetical protein